MCHEDPPGLHDVHSSAPSASLLSDSCDSGHLLRRPRSRPGCDRGGGDAHRRSDRWARGGSQGQGRCGDGAVRLQDGTDGAGLPGSRALGIGTGGASRLHPSHTTVHKYRGGFAEAKVAPPPDEVARRTRMNAGASFGAPRFISGGHGSRASRHRRSHPEVERLRLPYLLCPCESPRAHRPERRCASPSPRPHSGRDRGLRRRCPESHESDIKLADGALEWTS